MSYIDEQQAVAEHTTDGLGYIEIEGFRVQVRVLASRKAFGRLDVKVTPVAGYNEKWIQIHKLSRE